MPPSPPDSLEAARAAKAHARQGFLEAVDLGVEVRRVTSSLHSHDLRNHWSEGLDGIWRVRRGT